MPMDRLISVQITGEGHYESGTYVPGTTVPHRVWAERQDSGSTDTQTARGLVVTSVVSWTIRYRADWAATPISRMAVVDENGRSYNVEEMTESDARRRFLTIQAIGLVT